MLEMVKVFQTLTKPYFRLHGDLRLPVSQFVRYRFHKCRRVIYLSTNKKFPWISFFRRRIINLLILLGFIFSLVVTWQLLNVQLWYYIWCTYVIGQHSTMWSTCVAIQTKTSLQSLFKLDIKNEITTMFLPKDTTHRHRLALHCRSITCYMYIHVLFNLENLYLSMDNKGE